MASLHATTWSIKSHQTVSWPVGNLCPILQSRAVRMYNEERLASGGAGERNPPEFIVASEVGEQGLYLLARQRLMKIEQMSTEYSFL